MIFKVLPFLIMLVQNLVILFLSAQSGNTITAVLSAFGLPVTGWIFAIYKTQVLDKKN